MSSFNKNIIKNGDTKAAVNISKTDINKEQLEESQKRAVNDSAALSKPINEEPEKEYEPHITVRDYSDRIKYNSGTKQSTDNNAAVTKPADNTGGFKSDAVSVDNSIKGGVNRNPEYNDGTYTESAHYDNKSAHNDSFKTSRYDDNTYPTYEYPTYDETYEYGQQETAADNSFTQPDYGYIGHSAHNNSHSFRYAEHSSAEKIINPVENTGNIVNADNQDNFKAKAVRGTDDVIKDEASGIIKETDSKPAEAGRMSRQNEKAKPLKPHFKAAEKDTSAEKRSETVSYEAGSISVPEEMPKPVFHGENKANLKYTQRSFSEEVIKPTDTVQNTVKGSRTEEYKSTVVRSSEKTIKNSSSDVFSDKTFSAKPTSPKNKAKSRKNKAVIQTDTPKKQDKPTYRSERSENESIRYTDRKAYAGETIKDSGSAKSAIKEPSADGHRAEVIKGSENVVKEQTPDVFSDKVFSAKSQSPKNKAKSRKNKAVIQTDTPKKQDKPYRSERPENESIRYTDRKTYAGETIKDSGSAKSAIKEPSVDGHRAEVIKGSENIVKEQTADVFSDKSFPTKQESESISPLPAEEKVHTKNFKFKVKSRGEKAPIKAEPPHKEDKPEHRSKQSENKSIKYTDRKILPKESVKDFSSGGSVINNSDNIKSVVKDSPVGDVINDGNKLNNMINKPPSDTIKDKSKTSEKKKSSKAKPQSENKPKMKTGLADLGKNTAIDSAESIVDNSDDTGLQGLYGAAIAAETAVKILSPNRRTTIGDLRRGKPKKNNYSELVKKYRIKQEAKVIFSGTILSGKGITKNIVGAGKSAALNSISNGISKSAEYDNGIKAIDMAIKAPENIAKAKSVVKTTAKTGYKTIKTVALAPRNTYYAVKKGSDILKRTAKKVYKIRQMTFKKAASKAAKTVGRTAAKTVRLAASKIAGLIAGLITQAAGFILPVLLLCVIVFVVVSSVGSILPTVSLKAKEEVLSETWEHITELDVDFSNKYIEKWENFPTDREDFPSYDESEDAIIRKNFYINGTKGAYSDSGIKSNIDAWLLYLDCKYEDYKLSDIQDDIDELYEELVSYTYSVRKYVETIGSGDDAHAEQIYELNIYITYTDFGSYIETNKDTVFTAAEKELYEAIKEVGQYTTMTEFGPPIETDDTALACKQRYGYYNTKDSFFDFFIRATLIRGGKEMYNGIDIISSSGTNVLSPINGKVDVSGSEVTLITNTKKLTIGNVVNIRVSDGQTVKKGDVLGVVGLSGYIYVEYEAKKTLLYRNLNPAFYFGNVEYTTTNTSFFDYAIDLSEYEISDELTGTARSVVECALAMVGAGGYSGQCAKVASTIYQAAGLGYHGGNGNEFSRANKLVVSGGHVDYTKIPVGAYIGIKYGTGSAGFAYGHVGIYVGMIGGVPSVVEGGGSVVKVTSLDHFYNYYVTSNPNSVYGNDIGWNITSTGGSVSPLYFES